jgi:hypothetical protein
MIIGLEKSWLKLITLMLGLWSCSDGVPTTLHQSVETELATQLRLEALEFFDAGEKVAITMGDTLEVLATLEDSEGNSVPGQTLYITSELGNFFTENHLLTDNYGQATSLLLATVVGEDHLKVTTAGGVTARLAVVVTE